MQPRNTQDNSPARAISSKVLVNRASMKVVKKASTNALNKFLRIALWRMDGTGVAIIPKRKSPGASSRGFTT